MIGLLAVAAAFHPSTHQNQLRQETQLSAGFGKAAPKKKVAPPAVNTTEIGLSRPWDVADDSDEGSRAKRRGGTGKIGKFSEGSAKVVNPSGGMSAGTKLK